MPYLKRINELPVAGEEEKGEVSQRYTARTLVLLNPEDSTLELLAIELSSPDPKDAGAAKVTVMESEFLGSITPVTEALGFMSISSGPLGLVGTEVYLGRRLDTEQWTSDRSAAEVVAVFRARLEGVAHKIERRNANPALKNRTGTVEVPYTLLKPTAQPGLVLRSISNSITVC